MQGQAGCREDRADVWNPDSKVVRFGGRVQSENKIFLVTMVAPCWLIIAQGGGSR
jgi:hypothetical protein